MPRIGMKAVAGDWCWFERRQTGRKDFGARLFPCSARVHQSFKAGAHWTRLAFCVHIASTSDLIGAGHPCNNTLLTDVRPPWGLDVVGTCPRRQVGGSERGE